MKKILGPDLKQIPNGTAAKTAKIFWQTIFRRGKILESLIRHPKYSEKLNFATQSIQNEKRFEIYRVTQRLTNDVIVSPDIANTSCRRVTPTYLVIIGQIKFNSDCTGSELL